MAKAWTSFFRRPEKGGGALGANKESTHHVIAILLNTLEVEVEAACAWEVKAMGDLDLVEVEASCLLGALDVVEAMGPLDLVEVEASCLLGPLDVVGVSLNILISASVSGYLTSLKQTTSLSLEKPSSLDTSTTSVSIGIQKHCLKTLEVTYKHCKTCKDI
ncbi:hypothetical protein Tco_1523260 [Tanacetum coccineum]